MCLRVQGAAVVGLPTALNELDNSHIHSYCREDAIMRNAATIPRLTLAVGGLGLVVAGAVTLLGRVLFLLPSLPGLPYVWHPSQELVAAAVLLGAAAVLAFGVRLESGIVGRSVVGKAALVLFGLATFAAAVLSSIPSPTLDTTDSAALYVAAAEWTQVVVVVALVAAAAEVIRASVVVGGARWGLLALGCWTACELLFARVPYVGWVVGVSGGYLQLALEIMTGLLFVLQAQSTSPLPSVSGAVDEITVDEITVDQINSVR